jgi:hypothetical protein
MTEPKEEPDSEKLHVPPIVIDVNPAEEIDIFRYALHNNLRPWQRKSIFSFRAFQPIKQFLESNDTIDKEREIQFLGDFLSQFREQRKERINHFITRSQKETAQYYQPLKRFEFKVRSKPG